MKKRVFLTVLYFGIILLFGAYICWNVTERKIQFVTVGFLVGLLLLFLLYTKVIRREVIQFYEKLIMLLNSDYTSEMAKEFDYESETLESKLNFKLRRFYEMQANKRRKLENEKRSIQEMISDIAHQIKTPITNIKMYNSTLIECDLPEEEQKRFLNIVDSQIDKLDFLMSAMINMSRLENGIINISLQPNNIYDTVLEVINEISMSLEKKQMKLVLTGEKDLIINHDRRWMSEAIFNILDNAVKYTSCGGRIEVKLEKFEVTTKIEISDNGVGIPEQYLAQIFKRFYRGKNATNTDGVGVGLYLSRKIVMLHDGNVYVRSKEGEGTTFEIVLNNYVDR